MSKRSNMLAAISLVFLPSTLSAQSLWPRPLDGGGEVGLEWVRPTFANNDDSYGFGRGVWIVDGRFKVGQRSHLIAAIPWLESGGGNSGGSGFGNLMIGVEFIDTLKRPEFTLSLRHGHVDGDYSDEGQYDVGFIGDIDRAEQAFPEGLLLEAVGHAHPWTSDDGSSVELRIGATAVIVANDYGSGGSFYIRYGLRFGHEFERVNLGLGATGVWLISNGFSPTSTIDQGTVELLATKGKLRPSIGFRFPLDEALKSELAYALTVGVRVPLD